MVPFELWIKWLALHWNGQKKKTFSNKLSNENNKNKNTEKKKLKKKIYIICIVIHTSAIAHMYFGFSNPNRIQTIVSSFFFFANCVYCYICYVFKILVPLFGHCFFFSETFTNHRTVGEGGVHFFNSSLPRSPTSQTLRH